MANAVPGVSLVDLDERIVALMDAVPDATVVVDERGRIVLANEPAASMFGYSRRELVGQLVEVLVPERFRAVHPRERGAYHASPRRRAMGAGVPLPARRRDGSEFLAEISLSPWYVGGRSLTITAIRDTTLRQAEAERIREQAALLDLTHDAIIVHDDAGHIRYWSRGAESLYGWSAKDARGRASHELLESRFEEPLEQIEGRVAREGRWEGDVSQRRRDGTRVVVASRWVRDDTNAGQVLQVDTDVTQQREVAELRRREVEAEHARTRQRELERLAADLARSNAELENFAYVASHDLQEPLRTVSSFAQLLADRQGQRLDAQGREYLDIVLRAAERMYALINGLLAFSRVGTRGAPLRPVAAREALDDALANLQATLGETGAEVSVEDLPVVWADRSQLAMVFQNLVGNALKYHVPGERPVVRVSARRTAGEWTFSVSDDGIGIDPEFHERIFVIFQRLHARDEYPGTGIGLALCRKIVDRHGGRIWVESAGARGSTFRFTLPAQERS